MPPQVSQKAKQHDSEETQSILLVEDDRDVRESLGDYLVRNRYRVTQAANAAEARRHMIRNRFDLVVLDIMMPGEDGLSLCRDIRSGVDVPVILLSAKGEDTDRIVGLEIGADDYVTKPFNPRELVARMKAIVRRVRSMPKLRRLPDTRAFHFGSWTFKSAEQVLLDDKGVTTMLSNGENSLLLQFVLNPKIILSRDHLVEVIQGREAGLFDRSIDNQVVRLRRKLEPDMRHPIYIKTVWGGGYVLAMDVVQQ